MTNQSNPINDENVTAMVLSRVRNVDLTVLPKARSLSAVLDEINPQGEKTKLSLLVGHEITVLQVEPFLGRFGPAAYVIACDENNILLNFVAGQTVVLPKLIMAAQSLPVKCMVVEKEGAKGNYIDLE